MPDKSIDFFEEVSHLSDELKSKLVGFLSINKKTEDLFDILSSLEGSALRKLFSVYEKAHRYNILDGFLSPNQARFFIDLFNSSEKVSMSQDTIRASSGFEVGGIERSTFFSPAIAARLFMQMKSLKYLNDFPMNGPLSTLNPTTNPNSQFYEAALINPVFRFVKYKNAHSLIPHYDTSIEKNQSFRSTHTLIFYLTNNLSGPTRLITEKFENKELKEWSKSQIKELTAPDIYKEVFPKIGRLFMFEHGTLHDSGPVIEEEKLILTTEVFSYVK